MLAATGSSSGLNLHRNLRYLSDEGSNSSRSPDSQRGMKSFAQSSQVIDIGIEDQKKFTIVSQKLRDHRAKTSSLGLVLPVQLNTNMMIRPLNSYNPGKDTDLRFKNLIAKAFATGRNNSLDKVCHEIGQGIRMAFYPKGTRLVTAQLCALVDLESYEFD